VGDLMPTVLKNIRWDRRRMEAEILRVWNQLLDPSISAHAQPTGLARGTLFVTVDSSVWLDEIVRYRRKDILDRLQHSFGREQIARISFRTG
jgi:predicted nucleic acid-binding Zn ribbon protein